MRNSSSDETIFTSQLNKMVLRKKSGLYIEEICHKLEKRRADFSQDYLSAIFCILFHLCPSMLLSFCGISCSTVLSGYCNVSFYFLGILRDIALLVLYYVDCVSKTA